MDKEFFVYIFKITKQNISRLLFDIKSFIKEDKTPYEKKTIKQFIRMVNDGEFDYRKQYAEYLAKDDVEPNKK